MARAGRKRKPGVARSKGRIVASQRERQGDAREVGMAQRIARGAPEATWHDPMHGSVLGRLCLAGHITRDQHEAGARWAIVVQRFAAAWHIPMATPRAVDLNAVRSGFAIGEDESPERVAQLRHIRMAYEDGFAALRDAGMHATSAVSECVTRDEVPLLLALRIGLDALKCHFGLATT